MRGAVVRPPGRTLEGSLLRIVKSMSGNAELPQVVAELRAAGRLAGKLHGRKSKATRTPIMATTTSSSTEREAGGKKYGGPWKYLLRVELVD